jgi:HlyD family secretion protein
MKNIIIPICLLIFLVSCKGRNELSDAYGNFESIEYLVSAEGQGRIMELNIEEGDMLEADQVLGFIDTIPLMLQRNQLQATMQAILARKAEVGAQIAVQEIQRDNLLVEQERLEKLLRDEAATGKQMDDLLGQLRTIESQIAATRSGFVIIDREIRAVEAQVKSLENLIHKNIIINPVKGTVLEKYAEPNEMAVAGKALYKIADLDRMILRAYISGSQLSGIRIGQDVRVIIDDPLQPETEGTITWISDKSEFTPKIIQTREERVHLVYAIKVMVANDGRLKIGMPGELILSANNGPGS